MTDPLKGLPTEAELAARIGARLDAYAKDPNHPDLIGKPDGNPVQIRPAFPAADEWTKRHAEGVVNNVGRYVEGVRRPRANFKTQAIARKAAWTGGVQEAITNDRYGKGMAAVNEDLAIETAATLGAQSLAQGVTSRQAKIQEKAAKFAPAMAAAVATVRQMPANTPAEREARAVAMIRAARAVRGSTTK
jgi:hypothetical protein